MGREPWRNKKTGFLALNSLGLATTANVMESLSKGMVKTVYPPTARCLHWANVLLIVERSRQALNRRDFTSLDGLSC